MIKTIPPQGFVWNPADQVKSDIAQQLLDEQLLIVRHWLANLTNRSDSIGTSWSIRLIKSASLDDRVLPTRVQVGAGAVIGRKTFEHIEIRLIRPTAVAAQAFYAREAIPWTCSR